MTNLPSKQATENTLNYSGILIKNLVNHLKVLTLTNAETSITSFTSNSDASQSNEWVTCHESFSDNYKKLYLNLKLSNHLVVGAASHGREQHHETYMNFDGFLKHLDTLDPKVVLEQIQILIGCFSVFAMKPQFLLDKLNKTLFKNSVSGLLVRWGNCQK